MATIRDLREGQGIHWTNRGGLDMYAVVAVKTDRGIGTVPVYPVDRYTKCYDDGGAVRKQDKDNVRLRDCPPPFSETCGQSFAGMCYAFADLSQMIPFDEAKLARLGVSVVDGGTRVSERDMGEIFDHPWRGIPEAQLSGSAGRKACPGRIYGTPQSSLADRRANAAILTLGEAACGLKPGGHDGHDGSGLGR